MKALLNVNGHRFSIENGSIVVDGVLLDTKLKSTLLGASSESVGKKEWEIRIGKNVFLIDEKGFDINGEKYSYEDVEKMRQTNGTVESSKIKYRYTFSDVEVVEQRGSKDFMDFKVPSESEARTKNKRFRIFGVGNVSQVGSVEVNDFTKKGSQPGDEE